MRTCDRKKDMISGSIWSAIAFFQRMFLVIVLVYGDMVLITPLADCEPLGSLIRESCGAFVQVS